MAGVIIGVWVVVFGSGWAVSSALFEYTTEFWLLLLADKAVEVPLWATLLGGMLSWGYICPIALVTWIVSVAV